MRITIEFDDGRLAVLTAEELTAAFLRSIESEVSVAFLRTLESHHVQAAAPGRCPLCKYGRIGSDYCSCQLGRDLKRIETGRAPNPVGGVEGEL